MNCIICFHTFAEGEGQLGDICPHCGWEADAVEEDGWSSANHSTVEEARARFVATISDGRPPR